MTQAKTIPRICIECGIDFLSRKAEVERGYGKYCGRVCQNRVNGRKMRELYPIGTKGRTAEKRKAYKTIETAIRNGEFGRPDECEKCGKKGKIHGHHHDYSKPLEVQWLCPKCHIHVHLYGS